MPSEDLLLLQGSVPLEYKQNHTVNSSAFGRGGVDNGLIFLFNILKSRMMKQRCDCFCSKDFSICPKLFCKLAFTPHSNLLIYRIRSGKKIQSVNYASEMRRSNNSRWKRIGLTRVASFYVFQHYFLT